MQSSSLRLVLVSVSGLALVGLGALSCVSCAAARPRDLGVTQGRLKPLPATPNAVSSQADEQDQQHYIAALTYQSAPDLAWHMAVAAAEALPGAAVVERRDDYLWVECTTRWLRFVDDLELLHRPELKRIELRSAARQGYSDLGVNRARAEQLRDGFEARLGEYLEESKREP